MSARIALVAWGRDGLALLGDGVDHVGRTVDLATVVAALEGERHPRWTWWSARRDADGLVAAGQRLQRCWDLAEIHRLLVGGWAAEPSAVWAEAAGLPADGLPLPPSGDLFDFADAAVAATAGAGDDPLRSDGYLRPEVDAVGYAAAPGQARRLAELALAAAEHQEERLRAAGTRALATAASESAAAVLCLELERDGLPVDRPTALAQVEAAAGERPRDAAHADRVRWARDAQVLRHTPGRESTDLRNPAQVKDLLAAVGVVVPDTRKWRLEQHRGTHPVVDALLEWRRDERIATTYGYRWLDEHVGPDDRLRGGWTACDGAAGRMTAASGLHNLPVVLRSAVAAPPGCAIVRADLGQIEPRVLAAVSGDAALAAATRADDLYAPVAATLQVDRPTAKVAVLAAMYGQRSGAAGEALKGLERGYPVAMGYLDRAYDEGSRGRPVRTYGGRLVRMWSDPPGTDPATARRHAAAKGRFARNAVIQGSAAELFKAWAATVRHAVAPAGGRIVLCLHDELLVLAPQDRAAEVEELVTSALTASARRWTGSDAVRFVADASVITRWSDAKH